MQYLQSLREKLNLNQIKFQVKLVIGCNGNVPAITVVLI